MSKNRKKKIIILITTIILLYVITEVTPSVIDKVTPTETIEYGNLKIENQVNCYALRDETVYLASDYGKLKYEVREGRQLKVGTEVINFTRENREEDKEPRYNGIIDRLGEDAIVADTSAAKRKGVFSTYIDGYENYFTPANFKGITMESISNRSDEVMDLKSKKVDKNQPIYKLVDQSNWYIMFWIDSADIGNYEKGKSVQVRFDETVIKFSIEEVREDGKGWKVLLKSNRYYEKFAQFRTKKVTIISMDVDGVIIDNKYITTKGNDVGVYVISKTGEPKFVKIKSLGSDGEKTVVAEGTYYDIEGNLVNTVKVFDEILKKPINE